MMKSRLGIALLLACVFTSASAAPINDQQKTALLNQMKNYCESHHAKYNDKRGNFCVCWAGKIVDYSIDQMNQGQSASDSESDRIDKKFVQECRKRRSR